MFCKNCGKSIPDGSKTCQFCGEAAEIRSAHDDHTAAVSSDDRAFSQPKKRSLKLPVIAAVIAAVAVIGCVFAFSAKAQNAVMKLTSAETHYRYTLKNSIGSLADSLIDLYDNSVEFCGTAAEDGIKYPDASLHGSMYVEAGGKIKDAINELGIKENKISVDYKVVQCNDISALDMFLSAGGEKLVTLEIRVDKDYNLSLAIPELNGKAVSINLKDNKYFNREEIQNSMMQSSATADIGRMMSYDIEDIKTVLMSISENAPESKILEKLLEKYIKIILEQITDVERVSEKLEIEGVIQNTTRFDLKITEELLFNIAKAVLTEAKDDKDVKTFIEEYYDAVIKIAESADADLSDKLDVTAGELYSNFRESVEDALDSMSDAENDLDTKTLIKLTMWVNNSGETVAIKIKVPDADVEIFAGSAVDGKETGYEFYMKDSTMKVIAVTAKTTEAKGKISGQVNIEASDKEFLTVKIKDFDVKSFEKDGYINGTFVLEPGKDFAEEVGAEIADEGFDISKAKLEMTFATSEKSALAEFKFKYDGDALVTLGSKADIKDATEISLHSDYTEDLEAWATELDPTSIMEKVQKVLGENLSLDDLMSGMTTGTAQPSYPAPNEDLCEMCGIYDASNTIVIDGDIWNVCENCYSGYNMGW